MLPVDPVEVLSQRRDLLQREQPTRKCIASRGEFADV